MPEEAIQIGPPRGGGNRRVLVIAGVGVAILLAVFVLPGMLFGGGDDVPDDAFAPPSSVPPTIAPRGEDAPEETFEGFSSKNPFTPLVAVSTGEETAPEEGVTTSTVPPLDPGPEDDVDGDGFDDFEHNDDFDDFDDVEDDGTPGGGTTTPTTSTGPPPPPARQPDRVSLLEVFTNQSGRVVASVRVNDTTYLVGEGDEFATSYRVLDLDITTRCGQFLFGDDRFGLCEDEEVTK